MNTQLSLLYRELFQNKIVKNSVNLIIDYRNYFDIFKIIDDIKQLNLELHFLNIEDKNIIKLNNELEKHKYNKIFFYSTNIFNFTSVKKFNNIIFFDLFTLFSDDIINTTIENSKPLLKSEYSNIIFVNNVVTRYSIYMYHPISYINYLTRNNVYIEDMFDKLRNNNLYLVDSHRLDTFEILFYPFEYFSVICRIR